MKNKQSIKLIAIDENVRDLTSELNNGQQVEEWRITPSIAASFLVLFFKKTYKPLFPVEEYDSIVGFPKLGADAKTKLLEKIRLWMTLKEPVHLRIMLELFGCLQKLKNYSVENHGAIENLAKHLACGLVRRQNGRYLCFVNGADGHVIAIKDFIEYCIDHVDFFCEPTEIYENGKCWNPAKEELKIR